MHPNLIIEQKGRLLSVTLNRTEDNGVSDSMAAALSILLGKAHETADAVLLRSAGPDFCTGRIRDAGTTPPASEAYTRRDEYDGVFGVYHSLRSAKVPVIGVIKGRCMGLGTAIASGLKSSSRWHWHSHSGSGGISRSSPIPSARERTSTRLSRWYWRWSGWSSSIPHSAR